MDYIENHPFDEIEIGTTTRSERRFTAEDAKLLAVVAGEGGTQPADADGDSIQSQYIPGLWVESMISVVLNWRYPGVGTRYVRQSLEYLHPVTIGDDLTTTVTVRSKNSADHHVIFACECRNQRGMLLVSGTTEVIAPAEKIRQARSELPTVQLIEPNVRYQRLLGLTQGLAAIRVAVVHPCDAESLRGALEAATAGLIVPIFVGPKAKIAAAAASAQLTLGSYTVIDTPHSHAAAEQAVALARRGDVDALMKGSLHTDELMAAVVDGASGLRTGRRMSHVFAMDVPSYAHPLLITDAAINIEPSLNDKRDIVQNAIDLAHVLGIVEPRVAILSAVETINDKLRSTLDAAALCKMAERGQITGGVLDGPLAFDNAVSVAAATAKGLHSEVAGRADILVVPDLESGNMLAKQLQYLANAQAAGIVLGARVPIVLTSRADLSHSRIASCAMAVLLVRRTKN